MKKVIKMIYEMALKEFGRHKLRTFLTMLGVTIGIFLVTSVSSFSEGITTFVNDQISITAGLVTVRESGVPGFAVQSSKIDQSLVDDVRSLPGVEGVAEILFVNTDDAGSVTGSSEGSDEILRGSNIRIEEGRDVEPGQFEVVVGKTIADSKGYTVGDTIKIDGKDFEIVGMLEETGKAQLDNGITTELSVLQDVSGNTNVISIMMIQPSTPDDADKIERAINDDFDELEAATDKTIMKSVGDMLGQLSLLTFALGSVAALISGIVIMNVMMMAVRERRREIGTMKAIGATNRQVLSSIVFESVAISALGAVIGIALSFGGAAFLNSVLGSPLALVTPRLIVQGMLFAVALGLVSGLLPARQAAKLNPIEALRYE
jgi:putative ABC transport system permease protein